MSKGRPFQQDVESKSAKELIEMYSIIITRAVESTDETYIPQLNGTIKNATMRLLELGIEINSVYNDFITTNNEKRKREIIEIYDNETNEKLSECEQISNLLSSSKKSRTKSTKNAMNHRVRKLFSCDEEDEASSPNRISRSVSDPTHSGKRGTTNKNNGHQNEETESDDESESDDSHFVNGVVIKKEKTEDADEDKPRRGRPRKKRRGRPPKH